MTNVNRFSVQEEVLETGKVISASGNGSKSVSTKTARAIEIWVDVTANDTGDVDYVIKTKITGVSDFVEIARISAVAATGVQKPVTLNRADSGLGQSLRVDFIKNSGTSQTADIRMIRME